MSSVLCSRKFGMLRMVILSEHFGRHFILEQLSVHKTTTSVPNACLRLSCSLIQWGVLVYRLTVLIHLSRRQASRAPSPTLPLC